MKSIQHDNKTFELKFMDRDVSDWSCLQCDLYPENGKYDCADIKGSNACYESSYDDKGRYCSSRWVMKDKEIKIEWLTDEMDCETCGFNWASGAMVTMPDGSTIDLSPSVSCFESTHYEQEDVYKAILEKLGYSVRG